MCLLITDNPIQSCLIFTLSEHTYVPNLSSTTQFYLICLKNKQTHTNLLLLLCTGEFSFYFVLILILKINEIPPRCWKHICSHPHTEIMRLLKNRKIKKKEKLVCKRRFLSGSWGWCVYIAEQPRLCKGVCMLMAIDRNRRCCLALQAIHTDSWLWVQSYINNFASL